MNLVDLSVLIPVRATKPEHVEWLKEAVESVREQDYPAREIVICDDASTVPVVGLEGCRIYRMERRAGVCAARNLLGEKCVTRYLVFLDADDKLYEGALRKMAEHGDPKRAVYGDLMLFGNGFTQRYYNLRDYDGEALLQDPIMPITSLHTKAAFDKVGGFDSHFEGGLEEWDYNIRLMLDGICGYQLHEPLLWYRRHAGQRSHGRVWLRDQTFLIRDRYKVLEGMEMGCCGGRRPRGRTASNNPGHHLTAAELKAGEMVLVEYTGRRMGSIVLRGRETNTSYRFGASQRQRFVWPQDVKGIVSLPGYRIVRRQGRTVSAEATAPDRGLLDREAAQPPRAVPARERPMEQVDAGKARPSGAQDLAAIKGLGKARVAKLNEVGITRYEHLAVSDTAFLAQVSGASEKAAASWIEQARELA